MRNLIFLLLISTLVTSCWITDRHDGEVSATMLNNPSSEFSANPDEMPVIAFENQVFDFGTLSQGEKIVHTFNFKNEGKSPLILSFVEGSCGCTVMKDWPKEPIAPGKSGSINVEYDSSDKSGSQSISVRVVTNTVPATTTLMLEGEVVTPY